MTRDLAISIGLVVFVAAIIIAELYVGGAF